MQKAISEINSKESVLFIIEIQFSNSAAANRFFYLRQLMKWILTCIILRVLFNMSATAQASFDRETINVGNIGFSVTNAGTIGRPDVVNDPQGEPSMEYPINSGIEHLFEGGLWIGALVNGQTAVSTAAIDAPSGYTTGASGFEFTSAIGNLIQQKSTLSYSDYFSVDAVSHQDMIIDFTDANTIVPGTTIPIADHTFPLAADVHLECYAYNYSYADYFVILNYTITNNSTNAWDSVWMGTWTDLVIRNVNVATDNGSAFFNKGGGGFIDSLSAIYAFDVNGDPGYTNSYGASQFLGIEWRDQFIHPNNAANVAAAGFPAPRVNGNFWNFKTFDGSQYGAPIDDIQRFDKLKTSIDFTDPGTVTFLQNPSNRVQLISAGPIVQVLPGESFTYVIAMVCAKQLETGGTSGPDKDTEYAKSELFNHLDWAKRTYLGEDANENGKLDAGEDLIANGILDRYILPEPPATPKVKIIPASNSVKIYWDNRAEYSIDPISREMDFEGYRIYRSNAGDDVQQISTQNQIAQWDNPGNSIGYNNGFEAIRLPSPMYFEGDTTAYQYKFELNNLLNGWQYVFIITAFDQGDPALALTSLESSFVENTFRVWSGTAVNNFEEKNQSTKVGVYPNPYKVSASWDGPSSETKKIYFYNLPQQCEIRIYTLAGDIVATLNHDAADYNGSDIQWYANYAGSTDQRILPGGEHAWDILSESKQSISQGIYLFSVKDLSSNIIQEGQFVVIK
ncbi:MAG: hypothetical protein IPO83_02725 [Chitinophagaceae bacterium]|nr:hypothetical protein [Chitinophagaceae bacterium]